MWSYQLWTQGQVYNKISFKPMTASWDSKTSKKQIELKENLAKIQTDLGPLPQAQTGLFLHMDIEETDAIPNVVERYTAWTSHIKAYRSEGIMRHVSK